MCVYGRGRVRVAFAARSTTQWMRFRPVMMDPTAATEVTTGTTASAAFARCACVSENVVVRARARVMHTCTCRTKGTAVRGGACTLGPVHHVHVVRLCAPLWAVTEANRRAAVLRRLPPSVPHGVVRVWLRGVSLRARVPWVGPVALAVPRAGRLATSSATSNSPPPPRLATLLGV
jgi:hypothetical protein